MKTLLFTLEYPPFNGGVANYYGNMAKYWPIDEKLLVLDNSKGELLDGNYCCAWLKAINALRRKIKQSKIDYVLVGQILPLGTAAFIASLFNNFKYAVFFHGMDMPLTLNKSHKKLITKFIIKRADKIICANSYVEAKILEFYKEATGKTGVFNPAIENVSLMVSEREKEELREKYELKGKKVLFSLGRLVERKGFDKVIEALISLNREERKNLIYFIAGTGPEENNLLKMVPLELARKINFLGAISETEKWKWLNLADIFIMPSRDIAGDFEGFGIVYLEAALCGKPVIAGNSGGIKDAVLSEKTGLLVDPENIEEIKNAIKKLVSDDKLRHDLGENGRLRAKNDFNWEKRAKEILDFIK